MDDAKARDKVMKMADHVGMIQAQLGADVKALAAELGCSPEEARQRLHEASEAHYGGRLNHILGSPVL